MQRRKARKPGPHSLEHCLHQSARALHPAQRLAWLMSLVEGHREKAIEPLLKSLGVALNRPSPFVELGEALAWALGQLGRDILLPIGDRFKDAPFLVREHYCQALWYLGPQARGCQPWLKNQHTEWAEAVLYRLEGLGSQALIERRRVPVWLDQPSLSRLAELAFSQEPGDRMYALRALDGWGPERPQAVRLVRATLADPDDEVKLQAWRTLLSLGERPTASEVLAALRSQQRQLVQLASDHCDLLLGRQPPLDALEEALHNEDSTRAGLALARLLARPFPGERLRRFLRLLGRLTPEQQSAASDWVLSADWWAEDWARMVELEPPCFPLLDALAEHSAATLQLYLQPALRQRLLARLEKLAGGERLLVQLQGECLTWDRLLSLSGDRLKGALDAIHKSGQLPDQLLQPLYAGQWIRAESLELMAALTPDGEERTARLQRVFAAAAPEARGSFEDVLERLPDQGWSLLGTWLEQPELSEAAMDLLDRRLKSHPKAWSRIWEMASATQTRGRRDWVVAQAVCKLHHPDHFEVAAQLAQRGDFRAALYALEFLHEHYSVRERPRVLELTLNCLGHPDRAVRLDAIRHLRLNSPLPEGCIDQLLNGRPDPEEMVEQARLNLIRELTHLTPDQQMKVKKLTRLD
ncbi:HEAT repeat domain-containing protein [bacterium]|nr:HEAT repeat domain-containing protein [bacterium]